MKLSRILLSAVAVATVSACGNLSKVTEAGTPEYKEVDGQQALELQLVDELATSDDIILEKMKDKSVLSVKYKVKKPLLQKIGKQAEESIEGIIYRNLTKNGQDFIQ